MTSDEAVYRCLAGDDYPARIVGRRSDGKVDLAVDAGCRDRVELPRVAIVPRAELRQGTCAIGLIEERRL